MRPHATSGWPHSLPGNGRAGLRRYLQVGVGVAHGTACELEGIPSTIPRVLSDCAVSGHLGTRKGLLQRINKQTGNRVRMQRMDEATHEPVDFANIVKGYEVAKGSCLEVTDEELEAIAVESKRTIDIDEFVPKGEIDQLYNVSPYITSRRTATPGPTPSS